MGETLTIKAKKFQSDFLLSKARYPGIVSAWGTGKTMFGIIKVMQLSEESPNNLIMVVRKDWVDLRDSTQKDFERYTGLKIDSKKEVQLASGSIIMFRHGDEVEGLQNVNLGGFMIEQAEEFETDRQFSYLRGRLRRQGVKNHKGIIIANANGHNWVWEKWVANLQGSADFEGFQATTFDNSDNLPASYIDDLKKMEIDDPSTYRRLVLNSHDETDTVDTVFNLQELEKAAQPRMLDFNGYEFNVIGCDPAFGGKDECVTYVGRNLKVEDTNIANKREVMETVGELAALYNKIDADVLVLDKDGGGVGIEGRLKEVLPGKYIYGVVNGATEGVSPEYQNLKTEIVFTARDYIRKGMVQIPNDPKLIGQLMMLTYHRHSTGKYILHGKEYIDKKYHVSPDRAEALCYWIWGFHKLHNLNRSDMPMVMKKLPWMFQGDEQSDKSMGALKIRN